MSHINFDDSASVKAPAQSTSDNASYIDFDSNFDISGTANVIAGFTPSLPGATAFAVPEDNRVSKSTLDLTDTERRRITQAYVDGLVSSDKVYEPSLLAEAGYDQRTQTMIQQSLNKRGIIAPESQGLEADFVLPVTAEFHLVNKLAEPIMKILGAAGGYALRSWQTRGIPRNMVKAIEAGDNEAIATYLQTVEDLRGLKLGGEMLSGGKVSGNVFEQQKYADNVLKEGLKNYKTKLDSTVPYEADLANSFGEVVTGLNTSMKADVRSAYDTMKSSVTKNTYNIKGLKEQINQKLTASDFGIPETAMRDVEKILNYQQRTLSPEAKGAKAKLSTLEPRIDRLSASMKLDKNKSRLGSMTNQLNALKKEKAELKDLIPNTDYIDELDFVNMIQRINAHKSKGTMGMSKNDLDVQRGLTEAKKMIDSHFESATMEFNSALYEQFKSAQSKSLDTFRTFGSEGKRTPIGKILDADGDYQKVLDSILTNPHTVGKVGNQLDALSPGMGESFGNAWLKKKLGATPIKTSEDIVGRMDIDLGKLNSNLGNLLGNPENASAITNLLGADKVIQLKSLHNISGSLNRTVEKLGYDGPMDEGIRSYIRRGSGDGTLKGSVPRALELMYDKTRQLTAQAYDAIPGGIATKVPGLSELISKKGVAEVETIQRLENCILKVQSANDPALRRVFEKRLGAEVAQVIENEGGWDETTENVAKGMLAVGLAPAAIAKSLSIGVGTATYVALEELSRGSKHEQAQNKTIFDFVGDTINWFNK